MRTVSRAAAGSLCVLMALTAAGNAAARGGPAPARTYYPPTASGEAAAIHAGLPDPVVAALDAAGIPAGALGVFVQAVDQPLPLLALNAERKFALASTAKVVTTLAALDLLGPTYSWRTEARLAGELVDGRLQGDLLIVGGGNARLRSEDLLQWFGQLQSRGLRSISGDIVLDRLAFHVTEKDQALVPRPGPDRPHHSWPDALSLNDGVLRLNVAPAAGGLAGLSLQPPLAAVTVVNEVQMGRGCVAQPEWSADASPDGRRLLRVKGQWGRACGRGSLPFALLSEGDLTARAVEALWLQAGGELSGRVVERSTPEGGIATAAAGKTRPVGGDVIAPPFAVHESVRLPQLIREINKTSDNMAARALMLSMSSGFPRRAANPAAARERVEQWLRTRGVAPGDVEVDNGSGLSRAERAKPRAMVHLLRQAWHDRHARTFVDSLPIAGVDGTIANRMRAGPATGRAHLKTGSLLDVRAIAGYVRARDGRVYAVSALINHPDAPAGTAVLDALVEWLVEVR